MTEKEILILIYWLNIIAWLIPPFRQLRTVYFYYFLILAFSDPIIVVIYETFKFPATAVHSIAGYLLLISLLKKEIVKEYKVVLILLFFPLATISSSLIINNYILIFLFHSVIFLFFIREMILQTYQSGELNLFYIVIVLYELTIILKVLFFVANLKTGYLYYYLTTAFEILIGIYFCFYTVNSSRKIALHRQM